MSADNRTPHTDALDTLGMIHTRAEKRDAIHLGVEPVEAGSILAPCERICLIDGKAYTGTRGKPVGIVDPFLDTPVRKGERFWLIVFPRQITSLRHVWEHPDFPASGETGPAATNDRQASEKWLREFCAAADCPGYETVIAAAVNHPSGWDDDYLHFNGRDAHGDIPDEFWHHVFVVTGVKVTRPARHFSCSC